MAGCGRIAGCGGGGKTRFLVRKAVLSLSGSNSLINGGIGLLSIFMGDGPGVSISGGSSHSSSNALSWWSRKASCSTNPLAVLPKSHCSRWSPKRYSSLCCWECSSWSNPALLLRRGERRGQGVLACVKAMRGKPPECMGVSDTAHHPPPPRRSPNRISAVFFTSCYGGRKGSRYLHHYSALTVAESYRPP